MEAWPGDKMQPAAAPESTAERIRRQRELVVTCPSGNVYRMVRPTGEDLAVVGLSTLPYMNSIIRKAALERAGQKVPKALEAEVAKAIADLEKSPTAAAEMVAAQDRLFARIFLEPRFFAGEYAAAPPDRITRGHLGEDLAHIQVAMGMTPSGENGGEAALAVERFREEPGGEAADDGGPAVSGEAVDAAAG